MYFRAKINQKNKYVQTFRIRKKQLFITKADVSENKNVNDFLCTDRII